MTKLTIYTTPSCPWCARTKEFLKQKKIPYAERNVVEDEKARDEMIKKSGQMGVPVLDINGEIIVGFDPEAILAAVAKASSRPKSNFTTKKQRKSKGKKTAKKAPKKKKR